ncbi:Splicing factor 45 [Galemys pyrenaicus]|uniref:Splicing factor 45 n=1 Tax=Galemys pyrenaicus TaxID=202257 RepID=A0A8J6B7A0_GALPY|nr:Splicing factor 45 [Galemys pyrenaicus]
MVGAGEVDEDLEAETKEGCEKYGKVVKCVIFEIPGAPTDEAIRIFLEFKRVESAIKAVVDLNGRDPRVPFSQAAPNPAVPASRRADPGPHDPAFQSPRPGSRLPQAPALHLSRPPRLPPGSSPQDTCIVPPPPHTPPPIPAPLPLQPHNPPLLPSPLPPGGSPMREGRRGGGEAAKEPHFSGFAAHRGPAGLPSALCLPRQRGGSRSLPDAPNEAAIRAPAAAAGAGAAVLAPAGWALGRGPFSGACGSPAGKGEGSAPPLPHYPVSSLAASYLGCKGWAGATLSTPAFDNCLPRPFDPPFVLDCSPWPDTLTVPCPGPTLADPLCSAGDKRPFRVCLAAAVRCTV